MATKKLKLEVELETAKAKKQAKELETSGGGSPAATTPVSTASSHAARQLRELGNAAQGTKLNMKEVTRAFSGMAVGMAASYASKSMQPGAARDAVEYTGSAVTGAAMGMMAGPIGSAVGALGGLLKTYLDKAGEKNELVKDYQLGESVYKSSREQQKRLADLTDPRKNGGDISQNLPELKRITENYKAATETFLQQIADELKKASPDKEKIATLKRNVDWNRAMADRYDKVIEDIELAGPGKAARGSIGGTDALAKLGAVGGLGPSDAGGGGSIAATRGAGFNFGFSVPSVARKFQTMRFGEPTGDANDKAIKLATERSAKLDEEMAKTLKAIEENTKGGESWQ